MTTANTDEPKTTTARAIGHATISFGLVAVPVKLYTTNESVDEISFNMLHDVDKAKLKQQYICTSCNAVVDREHTIKGYEHAKGCFVTFTADEIKAMDAVATEAVELDEYVPADELDGLYIEKSYYLGPDKGAERSYALFAAALYETGLIGIGRWSARGKEYVVCVRPICDGLLIHQLRYQAEVKAWSSVPSHPQATISNSELKLAKQIITASAASELDLSKYSDRVHERIKALVDKKVESGETIAIPTEAQPVTSPADLMQALKASLDVAPKKSPRATPIKRKPTKAVKAKKRAA